MYVSCRKKRCSIHPSAVVCLASKVHSMMINARTASICTQSPCNTLEHIRTSEHIHLVTPS
jgi:hypothetical protein